MTLIRVLYGINVIVNHNSISKKNCVVLGGKYDGKIKSIFYGYACYF